nr:hypothetical protein B0A51_12007 [Rachicladosporium sp. CCFEE 5018]
MVSHYRPAASYADLPLPAPSSSAPLSSVRASSVTSGRSTARRHRHGRSGGSSAYLPQNEFPVFSSTGDVEIVLTSADGRQEKRYLLHRLILSQCSAFFEAGTRPEWSRTRGLSTIGEGGSRAASQERRPSIEQQAGKRWRYTLDWQSAGTEDVPMLVQDTAPPSIFGGSENQPPPVLRPKPTGTTAAFSRSMSNFSALSINSLPSASQPPANPDDEILKDYDNLFRIMYQYPPSLSTTNIATAYTECKALLHLADMYDALPIAGTRVDHHLLRFGARLYKQIAKYPPSYLKLGYLARSRTIFAEALIHVVGQWPLAQSSLQNQVDTAVLDLIEDKHEDLEEAKSRVEAKLWRLSLTNPRGDRVTPATDYLAWLAVSFFRSWIADNATSAPTPILKPPSTSGPHLPTLTQGTSGRLFRTLSSSAPLPGLGRDDCKRFLKLSPDLYTRDNLRRFERKVEELRNLAREIVRPICRSFLELDGTAGSGGVALGYLTCTKVGDGEWPWEE